ncbi:hypothetical protein C922_05397 [Plasmodium inui San Antonio 1]|uniref:Uncharacterized protein n=1 Tax=Plasmodium inui San Antonio 1 TaxID=1237626 RepID=W6ZY19_9APIC|nr:hypothetical protein C922_05397 [Plasmodium inui San Antonio 1]EUD64218.1 hypothetical protein C922_05397 [Plasmodium inui San Antonio 1]
MTNEDLRGDFMRWNRVPSRDSGWNNTILIVVSDTLYYRQNKGTNIEKTVIQREESSGDTATRLILFQKYTKGALIDIKRNGRRRFIHLPILFTLETLHP